MFESVSSLVTIQSFTFSSFWLPSMSPDLFHDCGPGCGHPPTVLIVLYVAHREELLFSTVVGCSGLTATNAPVGRFVHWMGCVVSFGGGWGS